MQTPTNKDIRLFIMEFFNDSELETFCFDYFPDVQNNFTVGMEKNHKVMQMMQYCRNRQLMPNLLVNLQQERPKPYQTTFSPLEIVTAPPPPPKTKPRNPNQIFISYATADAADLANKLATDLRATGHPIWIAPTSIAPGEKWGEAIQRGLQESGIFVLLLTPAAVTSFWVKKEMHVAMRLEGRGQMRILLLDVQACAVDLFWEDYQFIPFRDAYGNGWSRLQQALAGGTPVEPKQLALRKVTSPSAPPKPKLEPNQFTHKKTEMEFVRVPAGEFLFGDNKEKRTLPEFWISKTPVTNVVYERFVTDWEYSSAEEKHPVGDVNWHEAVAFCEWAGLALPTEAQWEKAARGTDGRKYPWGNSDPTDKLCNFDKNVDDTTPVGNYSPQGDSPYGCVDMSGNVLEWCLNKYLTPEDTDIDKSGDFRVMRGGSYWSDTGASRAASRYANYPVVGGNRFGFRVVVARRPPSP